MEIWATDDGSSTDSGTDAARRTRDVLEGLLDLKKLIVHELKYETEDEEVHVHAYHWNDATVLVHEYSKSRDPPCMIRIYGERPATGDSLLTLLTNYPTGPVQFALQH